MSFFEFWSEGIPCSIFNEQELPVLYTGLENTVRDIAGILNLKISVAQDFYPYLRRYSRYTHGANERFTLGYVMDQNFTNGTIGLPEYPNFIEYIPRGKLIELLRNNRNEATCKEIIFLYDATLDESIRVVKNPSPQDCFSTVFVYREQRNKTPSRQQIPYEDRHSISSYLKSLLEEKIKLSRTIL